MKTILVLFVANLIPITCVLIAGYLAIICVGGWGWFLLIALLTANTLKNKPCKPEN